MKLRIGFNSNWLTPLRYTTDFESLISFKMLSKTGLQAFKINLCALNFTWSSQTNVTSDDSPDSNKLLRTLWKWSAYECQVNVNFSLAILKVVDNSLFFGYYSNISYMKEHYKNEKCYNLNKPNSAVRLILKWYIHEFEWYFEVTNIEVKYC